jgi:hypothetical protein
VIWSIAQVGATPLRFGISTSATYTSARGSALQPLTLLRGSTKMAPIALSRSTSAAAEQMLSIDPSNCSMNVSGIRMDGQMDGQL